MISNTCQPMSSDHRIAYSRASGWSPKVHSALPHFKGLCSAHGLDRTGDGVAMLDSCCNAASKTWSKPACRHLQVLNI